MLCRQLFVFYFIMEFICLKSMKTSDLDNARYLRVLEKLIDNLLIKPRKIPKSMQNIQRKSDQRNGLGPPWHRRQGNRKQSITNGVTDWTRSCSYWTFAYKRENIEIIYFIKYIVYEGLRNELHISSPILNTCVTCRFLWYLLLVLWNHLSCFSHYCNHSCCLIFMNFISMVISILLVCIYIFIITAAMLSILCRLCSIVFIVVLSEL